MPARPASRALQLQRVLQQPHQNSEQCHGEEVHESEKQTGLIVSHLLPKTRPPMPAPTNHSRYQSHIGCGASLLLCKRVAIACRVLQPLRQVSCRQRNGQCEQQSPPSRAPPHVHRACRNDRKEDRVQQRGHGSRFGAPPGKMGKHRSGGVCPKQHKRFQKQAEHVAYLWESIAYSARPGKAKETPARPGASEGIILLTLVTQCPSDAPPATPSPTIYFLQ